MSVFDGVPLIAFDDLGAWLDWLEKNHDKAPAVLAKIAKKGATKPTATYVELREGALMYGWIDGITKSIDAEYYMIRFTPRRPKGIWSKINRAIAEALIAAGKMKPSGLAQVEAAKADGRWDGAYDGAATITVPADLQAVLDTHPKAQAAFTELDRTNRYSFLFRIQTAKTPELRARHIQRAVDMLEDGKLYHPKQ
jgi:uncharacterized protein YdeI (YjbR/CyaY-like superfamily)